MTKTSIRLTEIFKRNQTKIFIICPDKRWTYEEFLVQASSISKIFYSRGLRPGDKVVIDLENGIHYLTVYFACILSGIIAVPLSSSIGRHYGAIFRKNIKPKLIVSKSSCNKSILDAENNIDIDDLISKKLIDYESAIEMIGLVKDSQISTIHFTSGTTSIPKGIVHTNGNIFGNALSFLETNKQLMYARFAHMLPMSYMAGYLNNFILPLLAEAEIVIYPSFTANIALNFWEIVKKDNITSIWLTPTMISSILKLDRRGNFISLVAKEIQIFSATSPLSNKLREKFESCYKINVIETYGLSELLFVSSNVGKIGSIYGFVGPAINDVEIQIRSTEKQILNNYDDGEVWVKSPYKLIAYYNFVEDIFNPIDSDWFDTGDNGLINDEGYLKITGRRKDLIIKGGMNFSPSAIEDVIRLHETVDNACVIGISDELYGELICAYVELYPGINLEDVEENLRVICRVQLGASMIPDQFIQLNEIPKNSIGKIDKSLLREMLKIS